MSLGLLVHMGSEQQACFLEAKLYNYSQSEIIPTRFLKTLLKNTGDLSQLNGAIGSTFRQKMLFLASPTTKRGRLLL